jgi:DNA topoisomerase IA
LFDLPSLQKTCGQRWGWTADKTLAIAQELYDGEGKKLITCPRAEARHLAENQITDVPAIVAAMTQLRGFAHLEIDRLASALQRIRPLVGVLLPSRVQRPLDTLYQKGMT